MKHWTESQLWKNKQTNQIVPAGWLIEKYGRWLRTNKISLCDFPTFQSIIMDDGSEWYRLPKLENI